MSRRRTWGSGQVVSPSAPGAAWSIRWRESGWRRFESGYPSRLLAQQALDAKRVDAARERIGLPPDLKRLPRIATLADEWLTRRESTHRSWRSDRKRWSRHLAPAFGRLRAPDVDAARIRAFVEDRRRFGLAPGSVRLCVALLSTMFSDFCERPRETGALSNPAKGLPRSLRKLLRPTHDPRLTPYLKTMDDVARVYAAMKGPPKLGFAVGALAGLRPGEILALTWDDVDLERRLLFVRQQVQYGDLGPLKDDEPRILPISDSLLPVLREHRLQGGSGLLLPPGRPGRPSGPSLKPARFMRPHTLSDALRVALKVCGLPVHLTWYQSTRHTYASQYVIAGGSLDHLAVLLGHTTTEVTQRYAHLSPTALSMADVSRVAVDLLAPRGEVEALENGQRMGRRGRRGEYANLQKREELQ
jgi:integrase